MVGAAVERGLVDGGTSMGFVNKLTVQCSIYKESLACSRGSSSYHPCDFGSLTLEQH